MADKKKFIKPTQKKYSVREMLTQERMQESTRALRNMQTILWNEMDDESYKEIERTFDTAIASMMAHMMTIDIREVGQKAEQDAASHVLMPGA